MMTSTCEEGIYTISSEVDWRTGDSLTYDSRFIQDFVPVRLIGRGAYGRVFEAIKKIDGKHYAVKRIKLPTNKDARAKVMREVTALADLNHRNIVRYYHAWREDPPKGWQDAQDAATLAQFAASSTGGSFSSEEYSSTGTDEGRASFASIFGELKPKQLKISSSSSWSQGLLTPKNTLVPGRFDRYLYIQMELCRKDTLAKWLEERQPEQDVYLMYRDILKAVQYLHSKGLVHRDLKPSNIFFAIDGTIKVGDLGLVKDMVTSRESNSQLSNPAFDSDGMKHVELTAGQHTEQIGTSLYMGPELKAFKPYNHKVDVYALGIVLFELLVPFGTVSEKVDVIQRLKEFTFPPTFRPLYGLSAELLLTSMLSTDPESRPEIKDILSDPWLSASARESSAHKNGGKTKQTHKTSEKKKYYKILVIGDQNTGKTSIIHRYVHNEFRQSCQTTIGAGINVKTFTWPDDTETCQLTLEFFDIGGEERSRFMTSAFYRKAVAAFVVMDVTQPNGFQAATLWKKDLDMKLRMHDESLVPSVLLINKCDAGRTSELNPTQVDRFCRQNKFTGWFDTSAKDDINIGEAVQYLVGKILAHEATLPPSENSETNGHRLDENLSLPLVSTRKRCSII